MTMQKSALSLSTERIKIYLKLKRWPTNDIFSINWIDPKSILYRQFGKSNKIFTEKGRISHYYFGKYLSGDWDKFIIAISEDSVYQGLSQHFLEGKKWEDTCLHPNQYRNMFPVENKRYKYFDPDGFMKRAEELDILFASMRNNGWSLGAGKEADVLYVNVGRNGELIRNKGGFHRLAMSKIIGLDRVPIIFHTIHKRWLSNWQELSWKIKQAQI